ncbi:hypothetical protein [Acinetobacter colistiniresistens]|uniref:hypothetical protein n=1 Tax=Acinetobacter colistiniresistens TaxID=280145 RepID=UPI000BDF2655|nr:hypothetical protein [Acinetobacter colistiniresistens]
MEKLTKEVQQDAQPSALRQKFDRAVNIVAVTAGTTLVSVGAFAADANTIDTGTLQIVGLTAAAASVFAIKASPSLMMWGYRKILGFIGR